ncbi:protein kinase domain-containing protein [Leptothermofonsia sp. ETS-13]|uniref:protein kinase domain-containing protein n=1 Tax=Leptothermofonsia sp. ETS-13 TaxID=3035696 RepID=UPI003BA1F42B
MELYCTRPGCLRPVNHFADLDDLAILRTVPQKYCITCGMPLILAGHYLPLKLLGQGGFGAAFLARDRHTSNLRQCVIKQFQPAGNLSPGQLQMAQELFEREGKALEELGNAHPQIPDSYAFFELIVPSQQPGKQDQFFYLAQEYIDGQTMEEELAHKGVFSGQDVMELLQAILPVLKFVHENGFIHRDIKPSNIMRHRNGQLYLLDFGAVKQATKGSTGSKSTGIYSKGFAPPEQVSGSEVYPSTDLYALAVTCIMLLTGKEPNELYDSYSNIWKWRIYAPQIADPLADVLDRMLLPSPSQRFHSAVEVLEALKRSPSPASSRVAQSKAKAVPSTPAPASPTVLPQPSVNQPPATPQAKPVRQRPTVPPFSTIELLGGAAFTGFEGGLLAIALVSLLGTSLVSAGFWVLLLLGLVLLQSRRVIERVDLLLLAIGTLATVLFIPKLHGVLLLANVETPLLVVLFIAVLAGLLAVTITTLFRLIYKLLSTFL